MNRLTFLRIFQFDLCLILLIILLNAGFIFGQRISSYSNLEIINQDKTEFIELKSKKIRKFDGALCWQTNLNAKVEGKTPIEKAENYIRLNWKEFKHSGEFKNTFILGNTNLNISSFKVIPYYQRYRDIILKDKKIYVVLNSNDEVIMLNNYSIPINENLSITPQISEGSAINSVLKHLSSNGDYELESIEKTINFVDNKPFLSYFIKLKTFNPLGHWKAIIRASDSKLIEIKNPDAFYVNGTGNIFAVDPISSSHGEFGKNGLVNSDCGTGNTSEDCNSSKLQALLKTVTLLDITYQSGLYSLKGPNAEIFDLENNSTELSSYSQSTSYFNYNRSQKQFEGVMSYYYLDKSIRYVHSIGFPLIVTDNNNNTTRPVLKFDPHEANDENGQHLPGQNSYYSHDNGAVHFANGGDDVSPGGIDQGEDAGVIYHELGHFLHDVLTGYDGDFAQGEGLSEGFGDYWAATEANAEKQYKDWEEGYGRIFRWANWNPWTEKGTSGAHRVTNRTVTSDLTYPQVDDGSHTNLNVLGHNYGQIFSTVLMKIYNDLGKYKTDWAVLAGMSAAMGTTFKQPNAATAIFNAAKNSDGLNGKPYYSDDELCIMWEHFDQTYNSSTNISGPYFEGELRNNSNTVPDVYMKDNYDDLGYEANPYNGDYWHSEDIWVKNDGKNDGNYNKPKYNLTNKVNVRIRAKNCLPLENGILKVYWSYASTGQKWPVDWNGSRTINNRPIGGYVGSYDLSSLTWNPGEEHIIEINWNSVPNPSGSNFPYWLGFSFLARIDADPNNTNPPDPLHSPNQANLNLQARNENNVIWRNNHIFSADNSDLEIATVMVKDHTESTTTNSNCIVITNSNLVHYGSILDCGDLYIDLKGTLKSLWVSGGEIGDNITEQEDGTFKITDLPARFCNISLVTDTAYFADIIVAKNSELMPFAFDLRHIKNSSTVIGGTRFIYSGVDSVALPREKQSKLSSKNKELSCIAYPNPCTDIIKLTFNRKCKISSLILFDINGRELKNFTPSNTFDLINSIDISNLNYKGLVVIKAIADGQLKVIKLLKL